MAGAFFGGLGQAIAGGIASAATLGQVEAVNKWTEDGAKMVARNADKAWGKDGQITKAIEKTPVLGYVASAGHAISAGISGNDDDLQRARRACAGANKAAIVAGAATAGFAVGGPLGAAGAATLASGPAQCAEIGMNHTIDKRFQTDAKTFNEFDGGRFVGNIAMDGAFAAVGNPMAKPGDALGKQMANKVVGNGLKDGLRKDLAKRVVKDAVKAPVNTAIRDGAKRIR